MPDLPTLTVSQEHFDRLVSAFPGETGPEIAEAYKAWLVNRLIERVEIVESYRIDQEANEAKQAALQAMRDGLPPRMPEPGMVP